MTPTESCASDETEEEEGMLTWAPPGLVDPVGVHMKISGRLRRSYLKKQARGWERGGSTRLSRKGKVTNSVVGSHHVTLLQEAESHLEIANIATEQFRVYHGADQLFLFHKNTFEPGGVMTSV